MDDDEPAIEAKDLVNSYVVALEDEGDECCVVEDAETPMVLDDGNRFDTVNVELFQCLNGMVEEPALGMGFTSEDDVRDFYSASHKQDYDPNNSFSESLSSPVTGLDALVIVFTEDGNTVGKMVDEKDRPSSVFWVDTRSRIAYDYFSDVVAFDTTYQANQCMMPFAPFTGVNHHKQSVLFGCALLANETESTFIWIFTTWLEAVSGQQPGLIITDYDSTMTRAIERVFPQSTTDIASMNTAQKSVSVNSLFDGYVNARTALQDFAEQYVRALDDRYEKEAKAELETVYSKPILKTPLPMEKQAAELGGDDGGTTTYELAKFDEEQKMYFVTLSISEEIASCSCKMFQFEGILCRDVIAVFKATNVFILPQNYILQQWTKNARDDAILDVLSCLDVPSNSHRGKNLQYNVLYEEEIKCVVEGLASDHSFKVALNTLREARIKISGSKKNAMSAQKLETVASNSFQDENMISSNRDSYSLQTSHAGQHEANTAESCMYNNTFDYVWSNSTSDIEAKCGL
ncbi:protein FAR1-RELATED SEQUENCE 5-like [Populus nigra]|uniref:protein FAR1-RELATED SEQUENCE 5-like n=1 Tax=Populus nigra TaxID=3691 RepID=UPI002B269A18|nr:protein FAR1-RELATED SEQUENCE 5-like [Populus nigra]